MMDDEITTTTPQQQQQQQQQQQPQQQLPTPVRIGVAGAGPCVENMYFKNWVHVADFLLVTGASHFGVGFSARRTSFNPMGAVMLYLNYPARLMSGPLVIDRKSGVTFETLVVELVRFARLSNVWAIQENSDRTVYIFGPSMERMYREIVALAAGHPQGNSSILYFQDYYERVKAESLAARNRGRGVTEEEGELIIYPDLERFPQFKPPAMFSVSQSAGTPDMLCMYVHDVLPVPSSSSASAPASASACYLDLGCMVHANHPSAKAQYRVAMLDKFLAKHSAMQMCSDLVIHGDPELEFQTSTKTLETTRIGPVMFFGYATIDEVRANVVGKAAVHLSLVSSHLAPRLPNPNHRLLSLQDARKALEEARSKCAQLYMDRSPEEIACEFVYRDPETLQALTRGVGGGAGGGEPSVEDHIRMREEQLNQMCFR